MEVVTLYPVLGLNLAQFHTPSGLQCKIKLVSNISYVIILNYWTPTAKRGHLMCASVLTAIASQMWTDSFAFYELNNK